MKKTPNAEVSAVLWDSNYLQANEEEIQETCLPALDLEENYYRVSVIDAEEEFVAWVSERDRKVVCAVRDGQEIPVEDEEEEMDCFDLCLEEAEDRNAGDPEDVCDCVYDGLDCMDDVGVDWDDCVYDCGPRWAGDVFTNCMEEDDEEEELVYRGDNMNFDKLDFDVEVEDLREVNTGVQFTIKVEKDGEEHKQKFGLTQRLVDKGKWIKILNKWYERL